MNRIVTAVLCLLLFAFALTATTFYVLSSHYRRARLAVILGDPSKVLTIHPLKLATGAACFLAVVGGAIYLLSSDRRGSS